MEDGETVSFITLREIEGQCDCACCLVQCLACIYQFPSESIISSLLARELILILIHECFITTSASTFTHTFPLRLSCVVRSLFTQGSHLGRGTHATKVPLPWPEAFQSPAGSSESVPYVWDRMVRESVVRERRIRLAPATKRKHQMQCSTAFELVVCCGLVVGPAYLH